VGARTWFGNDPNFNWSIAVIGILLVMAVLTVVWSFGIKERRKHRRWRAEQATKEGTSVSELPHGGRHKRGRNE
jgi:hypothetical protein